MFHFPPIPPWDALHPLVIHFPIALLLLSPLFILIGSVLAPPKGQPYRIAGLIILMLGTIGLFVAASTGEAAGELAERGGGVDAVLSAHEHLAEQTRIFFAGLSVILLGMTVLPGVLRRQETRLSSTFMPLAFLILYSVGILFLVNTAHAGGRLVHEFGVHAVLPAEAGPAIESAAVGTERDE
ncbi:MAG: DUF2231 domain-containing protein [Terracidiphilus sp.]